MWDKIKGLFLYDDAQISDTQERAIPDFKAGQTVGYGNVPISLLSEMTTTQNEQSVLSIAAAYRCIAVRADSVAMLTGDILQHKNGKREYKNDIPLYDLIFRRPNPYMTPFQWRRTLVYNKLITGYGYGVVYSRDTMGNATELGICKHLNMQEIDGELWYYDAFRDQVYHHTDVICLTEIGPDGTLKSPLQIHAETFGKIKAASTMENELWTNKVSLGGSVTYPENVKFKKEQKDELAENIRQNYGGNKKAGRMLVLDQGAQVKQFEAIMSMADAEYIASTSMSIDDVCRVFGVPPFKIFHFNKMTYDNMEQMSVEFVQSAVMPDVMQLEQEINYKLFTPYQVRQNYELKFDIRSLMRADSTAQANWITKMVGVGGLTVNEVREMDDRNPVPGGDEAFIQANNYFPLSKMKELADATIKGKSMKSNQGTKPKDGNQMELFDEDGEAKTDKGSNVTKPAQSK